MNTIYTNTEEILNLQNNTEVIVRYNGDIKNLEDTLGVQVEDLGYNYAIITLKRSSG